MCEYVPAWLASAGLRHTGDLSTAGRPAGFAVVKSAYQLGQPESICDDVAQADLLGNVRQQ